MLTLLLVVLLAMVLAGLYPGFAGARPVLDILVALVVVLLLLDLLGGFHYVLR